MSIWCGADAERRLQATEPVERRLAAILAADVAGYSRHVSRDERAALDKLTALRAMAADEIERHHGVLVDTAGDGCLAHFASITNAVDCALALQRRQTAANRKRDDDGMELRIGIHLGELLARGREVFGESVIIASRLQAEALPGGICMSQAALEQVPRSTRWRVEPIGERSLKNIAAPISAYRLSIGPEHDEASGPALEPPDRPSIAVLPFANLSGDPGQDYLSDGITEEIITALSRIRRFFVIARSSTAIFKNRAVDIREVGRRLGVRYVLEGSVQRAGSRLRVTGQLIEAVSGHHVWAERYDDTLDDLFELQDQVTARVAGALEPRLDAAELARAQQKPTKSRAAYDLFLLGLAEIASGSDRTLLRAKQIMAAAIAADPGFALAKANAARVVGFRRSRELAGPQEIDEAVRLAEDAVLQAGDDATVLAIAASSLVYLTSDHRRGIRAAKLAVGLNPHSAVVLGNGGMVHYYAGEDRAAIEQLERAVRLSPFDQDMHQFLSFLSWAHMAVGALPEAVAYGEASMAANPARPIFGLRCTCAALAMAGRVEEARAAAKALLAIDPTFRVSRSFPRRHDAARAAFVEAFRLAGIPE
jgi:adenylate cyclase